MEIEQKLNEISQALEDTMNDLGLYMERGVIAQQDQGNGVLMEHELPATTEEMIERMLSGETFVFVGHMRVGDRAFHPRVEDPDAHAINREARDILPDEADLIRSAIEEGEDPFSLDLEDEEGD